MYVSMRDIRDLYGRRWREFGAAAGAPAIRALVAQELDIDPERVAEALRPVSVGRHDDQKSQLVVWSR